MSNPSTCLYVPSRPANAAGCAEPSTTPYGFCKKHSRTVQAKTAREQFEIAELAREIETDEPEAPAPAPAPAPEVEVPAPEPEAPAPEPRKSDVKRNAKGVRSKTIHPNYWGRYEDTESRIVFNPTDKCAYGVQEPSGRVSALKASHIEICKKNGWTYNLPYGSDDEDEDDDDDDEEDDEEDDDDDDEEEEDEEDEYEEEEYEDESELEYSD